MLTTELGDAYAEHAGAVLGLARRLLRDDGAAEDVVQEVFVRLWQRPERYDPARGALRTFLLADCHGRAVDRIRAEHARSRRQLRYAGSGLAATPDVGDLVIDRWTADQLHDELRGLPEREATPIVLAYFGGHTYQEVARILGEAEGTIKSRIRAGLRRLAASLDAAAADATPPRLASAR